jgi:MFS transporter, DHA2 family, multidrug resistance protein
MVPGPWIVAASVMLATFMEVLDTSVANVSLPHIAGSLGASTNESTWVLTSYLVANAIVLPASGWLASAVGRKRLLMVCIVVFTLASLACGAAQSLGMIIVARVLQGIGGGALQPLAQAILLESFPPEGRGAAMAVYGMGVVVAPIVGPTLGGYITDNYSWRWIFYINLPVGVLALLMIQTFVADPVYVRRERAGRIDYLGFALLALWVGTLQLALDKGQEDDWFDAVWIRWATLVIVVGLAGFLARELRSSTPIVDLRVLAERNFAAGVVLITVMGAILYASIAVVPLFLQTLLGYPAVKSGEAVSPRGLGSLVSMVVVGRLVRRVDSRILIAIGFAILGGATWALGGLNLEIGMRNVVVPQIVSGLAMGFIFVPLTTSAMAGLRNEQIGSATGLYNLMRNVGGSMGIAAATTRLARSAQVHQAVLTQNLNAYDPEYQQRLSDIASALATRGAAGTATDQAQGVIYAIVQRQAMLLAFVDTFRLVAVLCVLCVPLVLLFRKARASAPPAAMH